MPRLKVEDDELNIKELEEAEYDPEKKGSFQKYDGEIPPTGTMLIFRVQSIWWTYTQEKPDGSGGDPMLKVLSVAEDNPDDLEQYDGLPAWDNMALTPGSKFKWDPFLEHFGLTIRDVKTKTIIAEEDDNIGAPVEKIAKFEPGSDDALFVGVVAKEKFGGNWQAHIDEWLDADTELEEPEEEKPARRSSANGGRSRTSKAPAHGTGRGRSRSKADEEEEAEETEEEAPKRPAGRRQATSRSKPAASTARRGSRKPKDDEDEPPF